MPIAEDDYRKSLQIGLNGNIFIGYDYYPQNDAFDEIFKDLLEVFTSKYQRVTAHLDFRGDWKEMRRDMYTVWMNHVCPGVSLETLSEPVTPKKKKCMKSGAVPHKKKTKRMRGVVAARNLMKELAVSRIVKTSSDLFEKSNGRLPQLTFDNKSLDSGNAMVRIAGVDTKVSFHSAGAFTIDDIFSLLGLEYDKSDEYIQLQAGNYKCACGKNVFATKNCNREIRISHKFFQKNEDAMSLSDVVDRLVEVWDTLAEIKVDNGSIHHERREFWITTATYDFVPQTDISYEKVKSMMTEFGESKSFRKFECDVGRCSLDFIVIDKYGEQFMIEIPDTIHPRIEYSKKLTFAEKITPILRDSLYSFLQVD